MPVTRHCVIPAKAGIHLDRATGQRPSRVAHTSPFMCAPQTVPEEPGGDDIRYDVVATRVNALATRHLSLVTVLEVPQQSLECLLERVVILPIAKVADVAGAAQARRPGQIREVPSSIEEGVGGW